MRTRLALILVPLLLPLSSSAAPEDEAKPIGPLIKSKLAPGEMLDDIQLDVHWGRRTVTVHGIGVGIWNRQSQFKISDEGIREFLETLDRGGFSKLKQRYGGMARPGPGRGPAIGAPEMLVGSISLRIGDTSFGSNQLGGGKQSKELAELATAILDQCEKAAERAVTAENIGDGLKKIASGDLHPLSLSLMTQRIENEGRGPNGWILRINGNSAQVQLRSKTGIAQPVHLQLSDKELAKVCSVLLENDVAGLPVNLWAPDYTDFNVEIFRSRKNLQARKFARMTPTTHGEKQENFNRIFAMLDALQERVVKEGDR